MEIGIELHGIPGSDSRRQMSGRHKNTEAHAVVIQQQHIFRDLFHRSPYISDHCTPP